MIMIIGKMLKKKILNNLVAIGIMLMMFSIVVEALTTYTSEMDQDCLVAEECAGIYKFPVYANSKNITTTWSTSDYAWGELADAGFEDNDGIGCAGASEPMCNGTWSMESIPTQGNYSVYLYSVYLIDSTCYLGHNIDTYHITTESDWNYIGNITIDSTLKFNLTCIADNTGGNVWMDRMRMNKTDTCGSCNINCADQCVITSDLNCAGGAFTAYGAGQITFNGGAITNYNNKIFGDGVNACGIICYGGKCW